MSEDEEEQQTTPTGTENAVKELNTLVNIDGSSKTLIIKRISSCINKSQEKGYLVIQSQEIQICRIEVEDTMVTASVKVMKDEAKLEKYKEMVNGIEASISFDISPRQFKLHTAQGINLQQNIDIIIPEILYSFEETYDSFNSLFNVRMEIKE